MILLRIFFIFYFPLIFSSTPIVFHIDGDCQTDGHEIAQEHGYRFVRQVRCLDETFHLCRFDSIQSNRFSTVFVKSKKIRRRKITNECVERLKMELIQRHGFVVIET